MHPAKEGPDVQIHFSVFSIVRGDMVKEAMQRNKSICFNNILSRASFISKNLFLNCK